jgi:glycosyltransferase involved in cell wall biosynthesis
MTAKAETRDAQPQIIVAQIGARMHYAVPAVLNRAGMLAHFYTDTYVGRGSGWRLLARGARALPETWQPPGLRKLLGRQEDGLPPDKVTAFNRFGYAYARGQKKAGSLADQEAFSLESGRRFCDLVLRRDRHNAAAIYALPSVSLPLFRTAANLGRRSILEQVGAPTVIDRQLVGEEHELWMGWEEPYPPLPVWQPRIDLEQQEWQAADAILAPSDFVAQGLASMGVPPDKVRVVPYAVEASRFKAARAPWDGSRPLRVLFVGGVSLRKGAQYLYRALARLNSPRFSARMVGPIALKETYQELLREKAKLTGPVPRSEVLRHYQWADVLVFPTICDSFGLVQVEALAAGLPVITTPNAGSVVRNGVDGFIVRIRDADALADRLERLVRAPALLAEMSHQARDRAQEFNWERYGERLRSCLASVCDPHTSALGPGSPPPGVMPEPDHLPPDKASVRR